MRKFYVVVLGLAILLVLGVFYGFSGKSEQGKTTKSLETEKVQQETYVSKVVVRASWGEKNLVYNKEASKPGEFGYYVSEETEVAPNTFTIAPNGDIYISDPLNERIQRYSAGGQFISIMTGIYAGDDFCIDKSNYIYLGNFNHTSFPTVKKYDQSGKLLLTYHLGQWQNFTTEYGDRYRALSRWDGHGSLYCDSKGRLFLAYRKYYDIPLFFRDTLRSNKSFIFQIGTTSMEFSPEGQWNTLRVDRFLGSNTALLDKDQFFETGGMPSIINVVNANDDTIKQFRLPTKEGLIPTESFFGTDENGAIYTSRVLGARNRVVKKYDSNMNQICGIKLTYDKPYICAEKSLLLDNRGNIYLFIYAPEQGIKIIKWHVQPQ